MHEFDSLADANVRSDPTYTSHMHSHRLVAQLGVVLFYVAELVLWLFVARLYLNFGTKWIIPSVSMMWILGAATCAIIKEERESIVKETKWFILGFLAFLLLYRVVIQLVGSISSDQMAAALNITVPGVGGMAMTGFLQTTLLFASIMGPVGYLIYCAQKFVFYTRRHTKEEALKSLQDIRNRNQPRRY